MDEFLTIDIQRVKALASIVDEYGIGDDFILGEISGKRIEKSRQIMDMLKYPVRFDGYIVFFCQKGHFQLDVNLNTYDIRANSLLINVPGNITKVGTYDEDRIGDASIVFAMVSKEFLHNIHIDLNKIFQESMRIMDNPCITLNDGQFSVAEDYFNLARKILNSDLRNKREIIGSLLTSLTYMAVELWSRQLTEAQQRRGTSSARVNLIFERFISLVTEYHTSQRGMAFYADKLCLTPKYLSKLIKQASGRSAPDWIDSFVILEAKNMLKYSDMTIKEIVYKLHFPNQSVFYKFFKAHTGLTPSEYRNG